MVVLNLAGINQYGEPFGTLLLDPLLGGAGAYSYKDGIDGSGVFEIPLPNIANVETNENFSPILYLYRRFVPDTGGPGKYRGGRSGGLAFTLHDVDSLSATLTTHGVESPNSAGVFGGMPGSCNVNLHIKNTDLLERFNRSDLPSTPEEFHGKMIDLGAKPGEFKINQGDIFEYTWQGGGGYGDPLDRNPELVLQDVHIGAVSPRFAEAIFGVVLNGSPAQVDMARTATLRQRLKNSRLNQATRPAQVSHIEEGHRLLPMGENLEVIALNHRTVVRCKCGCDLGDADRNWKERAAVLKVEADAAGPRRKLHEDLEMVEFLCPACGALFSVDIKKRGEPFTLDAALSIESLEKSRIGG
jgi:N-methylhydantoinase B